MKSIGISVILLCSNASIAQHYDFVDSDFTKPDSIALAYRFEGNLDPIKIAKDLTRDLESESEKFRAMYRWIAENIRYDVKLYRKKITHDYSPRRFPRKAAHWKRKIDRQFKRHTIKKRMSICGGYAWLLETMCLSVGINCQALDGYARGFGMKIGSFKPNHAWNAVKIDNKWYLSDPTWGAGQVNERLNTFYKEFNEAYFLVDPNTFIANHYPLDKTWILLPDKPALTDFFQAPLKTTAYLQNRVVQYLPKEGQVAINLKKDSAFQFSFTANQEINSIITQAVTYKKTAPRKVERKIMGYEEHDITKNKEDFYLTSHKFLKDGNFDLEIYLNGKLTFIYKINVK